MGRTKDNAVIGSRALSRNEVLKVLPTFDNLFQQIEDLRNQITDIGELNNTIVDRDSVAREIIQKNNAFAILGKRGTGKTSIMYTIKERLQREQEQDIFLPLLIPDNMSDNSDIMGAILGMFHEVVKKQTQHIQSQHNRKRLEEFYDQDTCIFKKENQLVLAYDEMCKVYCYLKPEYKQIISKGYTDLTSYISKSSEVLSADSLFKTVFNQFIYQLVKTQMMLVDERAGSKVPLIHIFLDDIDLNPDRSGEIAKILLAYLAHPAVIVHISGDIDTFEEALTLSFLKTQDGMLENELLDQEIVAGQKLLVRKQELAYEYLKKIMPPVYRQQISYWSLKMRGLYAIGGGDVEGNEAAGEITLMDLLLGLFGEDKVGGLFGSYVKEEDRYEVFPLGYHIFDETSRGLNNVYLYLMQEYKRRENNKRAGEAKPEKEYEFIKKFFDIVVNANPRLNKNRALIDSIIRWGEKEEKTLIKLDNYSYVLNRFLESTKEKVKWKKVSFTDRDVKEPLIDQEEESATQNIYETALEYFTVFELIYIICRVLESAGYDEKELDASKQKALELLWDFPVITESPVKVDSERRIAKLTMSPISLKKSDKNTEEIDTNLVDLRWCLTNLYMENNFEIAVHYYQELISEIGYGIGEDGFSQIKFLSCFARVLSQFSHISIIKQWCENNAAVLDYLFRSTTLNTDNMIVNNLLNSIVITEKSFDTVEEMAQITWLCPKSYGEKKIKLTKEGICFIITRLIKNSIQQKTAIQLEKPSEVKENIENRLGELLSTIDRKIRKSREGGEYGNDEDETSHLMNLKLLIAVIKNNLTDQRWAVQLLDSNIKLITGEIINSLKHKSGYSEVDKVEKFVIKSEDVRLIFDGFKNFENKLRNVGTNTIAFKTKTELYHVFENEDVMSLDVYLYIHLLVSELAANYRVLYGRKEAQEFLKIIDNAGIEINAFEENDSFLMIRILCYISYSITMNKNINDLFESARLMNELNRDIMETEREYDQEIIDKIKDLLELSDDDISGISDISAILEA